MPNCDVGFTSYPQSVFCLYQILDNGDKRYTLNRGVIDRLSRKGAELLQEKFNENLITAKNEGNPFGYSSKSYIYGRYSSKT